MIVVFLIVVAVVVAWVLHRALGGWSGLLQRAALGVVVLVVGSGLLTGTVSCG